MNPFVREACPICGGSGLLDDPEMSFLRIYQMGDCLADLIRHRDGVNASIRRFEELARVAITAGIVPPDPRLKENAP